MSHLEEDGDKLSRQTEEDCPERYFAEDVGTYYQCILPAGHDGPHIDWTGIEF